MTSLLGMHWLREHPDNNRDLAHIERMQYPSIKLFKNVWDNRETCAAILSVLPKDSYILGRDHALSEQKEQMWSDPAGHGIYHANEWADKVHSGRCFLPTDRTFFLGINEPDATDGDRNAIDIYTSAFLDRLRTHGLRGGAFNFSTGHPRTVDGTPNTPADYTVFERSHQAIVRGHHIGVLHIYGTGAVPCAPGHYDRLKACTWQDVEWIVGEFGVDEHVIGGGPHLGFHHYFNGRLNDYCAWLDTAIMGIADPRIHSYQVFTYDYSHPWSGFDVSVIGDALESYPWRHMAQPPGDGPQPTPEPVTTLLPHIGAGTPAYVAKPAELLPTPTLGIITASVLNVRSGPSTDYPALRQLQHGDAVTVTARAGREGSMWLQVGVGEWVYEPYITTDDDGPQPTPSDTWQRSRAFIAKWEGEYQNVPNDAGNWTGCKVGMGENKGTKYGISACSYPHLDIKNITMEQADAIYFTDYWQASGAATMPYPLCLLMLDTAVLHGVGTAKAWLAAAGPNPYAFAAMRLRVYINMTNWDFWGKAWVRRVADLLEEMSL